MTLLMILLAILLLGILITVHEFGHFIAARIVGIKVQEFAIGFGPKLIGWKSKKHETKFALRLIPMGGYCMFYGEDDPDAIGDVPPEWAYHKQPVWKRLISLLMGPGMNFILAFVVAVGFYAFVGVPTEYTLGFPKVIAGGPAYEAGLESKDKLVSINGIDLSSGSTDEAVAAIAGYDESQGPLEIKVTRGDSDEVLTYEVIPIYVEADGKHMINVQVGAVADGPSVALPFGESVKNAWNMCIYSGGAILNSLKDMLFGQANLDDAQGPVGIISTITEETREEGLMGYLNLLIILSINLGLFNLLPIPGLDGSRVLFLIVEGIRRKPIDPKKEAMVHLVGFGLLLLLILFFTYKDIVRLFTP